MRKACLALILALVALMPSGLWAAMVRAPFAISIVSGQIATGNGNDAAITFSSNWTVGNCVVVASILNNTAQTIDLTDITETEATLHDESEAGPGLRGFIFAFVVDASADNTITTTTSGSAPARSVAVELAGSACTEDGTSQGNADNLTPYELTTDVTTTVAGAFLIGLIHSNSAADYTVTGLGTSLTASDAEIGTVALGQYQITATAAAYDTTYTSAANEDGMLMAAAIAPSAAAASAPKQGLLGVGRPGAKQ